MKKTDLNDAFPPVDEGFERGMSRAFEAIGKEKVMKHKIKYALLAAAILALALAGTAVAAGWSALQDALNGIGAENALNAVKKSGVTAEENGVSVAVKETLVEGSCAYITLECAAPQDEPMLLAVWSEQEGVNVDTRFEPGEGVYMIGGLFGREVLLAVERWGDRGNDHGIGTLDLDLSLAFLKPSDALWTEISEAYGPALIGGNAPLTSAYVWDVAKWNRYSESERVGLTSGQRIEGLIQGMADAGVAEEAARMAVAVPLRSADEGGYLYRGVKQDEFRFDKEGYTLKIESLWLGEVDGEIVMRVVPDHAMEEMTQDSQDPLCRFYRFYDAETGKRIYASGGGSVAPDENGWNCYDVEYTFNAAGACSGRLRAVPMDMDGTEYPDEAVVLELIP